MVTRQSSRKKPKTDNRPVPLSTLIPAALRCAGGHIVSEFRLNKLLYLADWYHALMTGRQLTDLKWVHRQYGPFLPEVNRTARELDQVNRNFYRGEGPVGTEYVLHKEAKIPQLEAAAAEAISAACTQVAGILTRSRDTITEIVYATLPMKHAQFGEVLEIERWAEKERRRRVRRFRKKVLPRYGPLLRELAK